VTPGRIGQDNLEPDLAFGGKPGREIMPGPRVGYRYHHRQRRSRSYRIGMFDLHRGGIAKQRPALIFQLLAQLLERSLVEAEVRLTKGEQDRIVRPGEPMARAMAFGRARNHVGIDDIILGQLILHEGFSRNRPHVAVLAGDSPARA
jgi:hypothetical protein